MAAKCGFPFFLTTLYYYIFQICQMMHSAVKMIQMCLYVVINVMILVSGAKGELISNRIQNYKFNQILR